MSERVAVYIDGANAYFAQKEALNWWIDWPSFLKWAKDGRELASARWYQSYRNFPEPEQERFLHHLTLVGFAVRKKILKSIYDRNTGQTSLKGNLNVELVIDALTESPHYDTVILVTGDSDFVPLVEALRVRGKKVIVAATQQNVAVELRQAVGVNYVDLRDLRDLMESDKRAPERSTFSNDDFAAARTAPAASRMAPDARTVSAPRESFSSRENFASPETSLSHDDEEWDREDLHYEESEPNGNLRLDHTDGYEVTSALDPHPPSVPNEDIDLPQEGEIIRCRVQAVKKYGVFLDLHESAKTLLHVKDMHRGYVADAAEFYRVGEEVTVQVVGIDWTRQPPEVRVQVVTAEMEY